MIICVREIEFAHTPDKSPRLHCFFLRPYVSVYGAIRHEWTKSIVLGVLGRGLGLVHEWHTSGNRSYLVILRTIQLSRDYNKVQTYLSSLSTVQTCMSYCLYI